MWGAIGNALNSAGSAIGSGIDAISDTMNTGYTGLQNSFGMNAAPDLGQSSYSQNLGFDLNAPQAQPAWMGVDQSAGYQGAIASELNPGMTAAGERIGATQGGGFGDYTSSGNYSDILEAVARNIKPENEPMAPRVTASSFSGGGGSFKPIAAPTGLPDFRAFAGQFGQQGFRV